MRHCSYLTLLFILFSNILPAQDITGLWKGTSYNDTTGQLYRYEIAISEEKGKLSGYSHTWVIDDDKQYYGVKKIKIKKQDGKIIVEDVSLIANNYPVVPDKNIRQLSVLTLEVKDSILTMTGPYSTNRTKMYHSLTGSISVQRKNDFWQSALIPHLQELGKARELSFVQEEERTIAKKETEQKEAAAAMLKAATPEEAVVLHKASGYAPAARPAGANAEKENTPSVVKPKEAAVKLPPLAINETAQNDRLSPPALVKNEASRSSKETVIAPVTKTRPADEVEKRRTELQQTVYFKTDSLQLSLYDNGEVDGDTVSVLMNGTIIMAKERLSTNAVRKTIRIDPSQDSVQLVMYAENLGTIAPNTGLLVVKDGKDLYEIRFSGDLNKNAAILFKRKK
jgi:hypothetical protein